MSVSLGRKRPQNECRNGDVASPSVFRKFSIFPKTLRQLGRRIREIFPGKQFGNEVPLGLGHRSQVLAEQLSKVAGASMIWCSLDGELLVPIVHSHDQGVEIIGLGCLACHEFLPTPAGVL